MSNKFQFFLNNHPHQIIFHFYHSHCTFIIMTAVLPDDEEFFQDGPAMPSITPRQANLTWARSSSRIRPSAPAPGARGCMQAGVAAELLHKFDLFPLCE